MNIGFYMAEQITGDSALKEPVLVKAKPAKAIQKKPAAKAKPVKKKKPAVKKAVSKKAPARKAVTKKKTRPAAKTRAKAKKPAKTALGALDRKVAAIHAELGIARSAFEKNESLLSKKIAEKIRLEAGLNQALRKNFAMEKLLLASIRKDSAKKEAGLREQIASLEKVTKVYEEKKARIDQAKKRQDALKKQLLLLERQAGA